MVNCRWIYPRVTLEFWPLYISFSVVFFYPLISTSNGNPLQYSCLGNPMDKRAWWAIVQGVTKESGTTYQLSKYFHTLPTHSHEKIRAFIFIFDRGKRGWLRFAEVMSSRWRVRASMHCIISPSDSSIQALLCLQKEIRKLARCKHYTE